MIPTGVATGCATVNSGSDTSTKDRLTATTTQPIDQSTTENPVVWSPFVSQTWYFTTCLTNSVKALKEQWNDTCRYSRVIAGGIAVMAVVTTVLEFNGFSEETVAS